MNSRMRKKFSSRSACANCTGRSGSILFADAFLFYFTDLTISMGESKAVVSAYTTYTHLQQYCSHPWICRSAHITRHENLLARLFSENNRGIATALASAVPSLLLSCKNWDILLHLCHY